MENKLSTLTTDDLQIQLEQLRKVEAEAKARELFKQELSAHCPSYQEVIEKFAFTGFMHAYTRFTADVKTMTTRAKQDVVLSLAKSDLSTGQTFFFVNTKA